jgi:glycosyltransferase involved in cell wall biosynthesis
LWASADIYHAHNVHMLPAAWLAARIRRKPVVYDAHELLAVQTPSGPQGRFTIKQRLEVATERVLAPRADAKLTVSTRYANQLAQSLNIEPPVAIANFPPLPPVPERDSSPLRAMLGVNASDTVLLYQGGFYPDTRALDVVVNAMTLLPDTYWLALLGFGRPRAELALKKLAAGSPAADRIRFLPSVPFTDLPRWTAGADVGVIPFKINSAAMKLCSPNKLYEYLGAGVAVVATEADELVDVLERSRAGLTYRWQSAEDFARAVRALADDSQQLAERKRCSRRAAENGYSWAYAKPLLVQEYARISARITTGTHNRGTRGGHRRLAASDKGAQARDSRARQRRS